MILAENAFQPGEIASSGRETKPQIPERKGHGPKIFGKTIFFFMSLFFLISKVSADKGGVEDISRINNGIYFKGLLKIQPTISERHHSFIFEMPSRKDHTLSHHDLLGTGSVLTEPAKYLMLEYCVRDVESRTHRYEGPDGGGHNEARMRDLIQGLEKKGTPTEMISVKTKRFCVKFERPIIKLLQTLKRDHDNVNELVGLIEDLCQF